MFLWEKITLYFFFTSFFIFGLIQSTQASNLEQSLQAWQKVNEEIDKYYQKNPSLKIQKASTTRQNKNTKKTFSSSQPSSKSLFSPSEKVDIYVKKPLFNQKSSYSKRESPLKKNSQEKFLFNKQEVKEIYIPSSKNNPSPRNKIIPIKKIISKEENKKENPSSKKESGKLEQFLQKQFIDSPTTAINSSHSIIVPSGSVLLGLINLPQDHTLLNKNENKNTNQNLKTNIKKKKENNNTSNVLIIAKKTENTHQRANIPLKKENKPQNLPQKRKGAFSKKIIIEPLKISQPLKNTTSFQKIPKENIKKQEENFKNEFIPPVTKEEFKNKDISKFSQDSSPSILLLEEKSTTKNPQKESENITQAICFEKKKNPQKEKLEKSNEEQQELEFYKSEEYKALPTIVMTTQESPQIKFSGSLCSYIGNVMQDDTREGRDGSPHIGFGWADLAMEISGATHNNFHYKYAANLEIIPSGSIGVSENYLELSCPYGIFQFGNVSGIEGTFIEDATSLLGGMGGINGSLLDLFNMSAGLPNPNHLVGFTKKATKLVLYSPRWLGFQLGLSFCPNPHHIGNGAQGSNDYASSNSNDDNVFHTSDMKKTNNIVLGINFKQDLQKISFNASVLALKENTKMNIDLLCITISENQSNSNILYGLQREIALKKDTSYQASGSIKYKNLQLAAGFINNGYLNLPHTNFETYKLEKFGMNKGNAGDTWNRGIKYTIGCIDLGLAHYASKRRVTNYKYAKSTINTLTIDCQIVSGVKIFAEVNHVDTYGDKAISTLYDGNYPIQNKGTAVMIGSKVNF